MKKPLYIAYFNAVVVVANTKVVGLDPGANPTTAIYNARVSKSYNAYFQNRTYFFLYCKTLLPTTTRCGCKYRNRRIGSRLVALCGLSPFAPLQKLS
jgi:hypothetical protein